MKLFSKIIVWTLTGTLMFSCEKPEQLGPDLKGIYGPVTVIQAFDKSLANPDFANGDKVYFTAKFQNDAIWKITIIGNTTGAKKTIEGVSAEIGVNNSVWDGSSDDLPSFGNESITATLSFQSSTTTYSTNITIAGKRVLGVGGVLVSDFQTMGTVFSPPGQHDPPPAGWVSDWPVTNNTNNAYPKAEGNNYLFMSGYPWGNAAYAATPPITPYVDYLEIPAKYANGGTYGDYYPLPANSGRVYFNLMVYNSPAPYTRILITFNEAGGTSRTMNIIPDWPVGTWKLVSFNYLETTGEATATSNRIRSVQFTLLSTADQATLDLGAAGETVTAVFDYPVFTLDGPLIP